MNGISRLTTVAAAAVAIVMVGLALAKVTNVGGPAPTAVPTATPPQLNTLPTGDLAAGTYEIDAAIPVRLIFTLPSGFNHDRGGIVAIHGTSGVNDGLEFQFASNVYPDPCHRATGAADPAVGASVDDLVTAMTSMVGFQAGPVTDLTIAGFPAKAFDLTNEIDSSTCDVQDVRTFVWVGDNPPSGSSVGSGEHQRVYVMKVGDTRLMIMTYYFPNGDPAAEAAAAESLKKIVKSIQIL